MTIHSAARFADGELLRRPDLQIGGEERDLVAAMLREVAPTWSVDVVGDFPGGLSMVIMPTGADDTLGPTWIIHNSDASIHLDQMLWDEWTHIATVPTVRHAVDSVRARLRVLGEAVPVIGP